jgi:hypothetical protein
MTDASGYQTQALDALGPANSSLGGRHSIVGRPTAIIAAALWLSSTSRFTAVQVGCCCSRTTNSMANGNSSSTGRHSNYHSRG